MDGETMLAIFISCHLIGMASTVFNPIMYGYKNEPMRRDLIIILNKILRKCGAKFYTDNGAPPPGQSFKTGEQALGGEDDATMAGIGLGMQQNGDAEAMLGPQLSKEINF